MAQSAGAAAHKPVFGRRTSKIYVDDDGNEVLEETSCELPGWLVGVGALVVLVAGTGLSSRARSHLPAFVEKRLPGEKQKTPPPAPTSSFSPLGALSAAGPFGAVGSAAEALGKLFSGGR